MVVGCPDALRAVVRTVLQIAERERPRAEAILLRSCFAGNGRALEASVLFNVDVEAAFSSDQAAPAVQGRRQLCRQRGRGGI